MLFLLSQIAPAAVAQQLDEATLQLEKTMKGIPATNDTVKKYLERAAEMQRTVLPGRHHLKRSSLGRNLT